MAITIAEAQVQFTAGANGRPLSYDNTPTAWTPAANDFLLHWVFADQLITSLGTTSGWVNPLGAGVHIDSDSNVGAAFYHWVTSAEASGGTKTYTISNCFSPSRAGGVGGLALRGVDPTNPIKTFTTTFNSGDTATPHVLPGVPGASLAGGETVFSAVMPDENSSYTTPSGWTKIIDQVVNAGRNIWIGQRTALTSAGVTIADTNITPSAGGEFVAITFVLTPTVSPVVPVTSGTFFSFMSGASKKSSGPTPPTIPDTPDPVVIYDSGLTEPFQYAPTTTGTTRDVTTFGATINNSSNDDTAAIKAAISAAVAGDEIYFPNGNYHIKGSGNIQLKSGVNLRGQSVGGAIINTKFTSSTTAIFKIPSGSSNIRIENLTIQKESGSTFDAHIRLSDEVLRATTPAVNRVVVKNCVLRHHKRFSVFANNAKHLLVDGCTIKDAVALDGGGQGYGVMLNCASCHNNWIRSNIFGPVIRHAMIAVDLAHHNLWGGTLDGFEGVTPGLGTPHGNECGNEIVGAVSDATDMHGELEYSNEISYNYIHDNVLNGTTQSPNGSGVGIGEPPTDTTLGGSGHDKSGQWNWIHHNRISFCPQGIRVMNQSNNTVMEDNYIHDCDDGILVDQQDGYKLTGVVAPQIRRNTIQGCGNGVRLIDTVTSAIVEDNLITGNDTYGIYGDALTTGYLVQDNIVSGNGTDDVLLLGTGTYIP
jgi:hypothetical protein